LFTGDHTATFSDLSALLETSPLRDDQIQNLVDMLLTRKDGEWQSANSKNDNSAVAWKKKYEDIKEQFEDGESVISSICVVQGCNNIAISHIAF